MSDEQTIYISPEDDVTSVRERLEQIPTRRVTLVIERTQLRGLVAWKVLHTRVRELGKEVLIVSGDPQIRSVAQEAKFKVAASLDAAETGKTRQGSGRTDASRSRPSGTRSTSPQSRTTGVRRPTQRRWTPRTEPPVDEYPPHIPDLLYGSTVDSTLSQDDESATKELRGVEDDAALDTFDMHVEQPYEFIDILPPIQPLSIQEEDEPNHLLDDYQQAVDIRKAHQEGLQESENTTDHPVQEDAGQLPGIGEQIEDQGDQGDFFIHPDILPVDALADESLHDEERDMTGPPRPHGPPTRSSRTGSAPSRPLQQESDDAPSVVPAASQPTPTRQRSQQPPPSTRRQDAPSRATRRASANVAQGRQRTQRQQPLIPSLPRFKWTGILVACVVLASLIGVLVYAVPSADVRLTFPGHPYTHAIQLTVLATGQATDGALLAEPLSPPPFTAKGLGKATDSKQVGVKAATGTVTFTNNGSTSISIPTGTVVTTSDNKQFATTSEALVSPAGSQGNPVIVPVQAQNSGVAGNVGARSITSILPSSLDAIAKASSMVVADIKLSVTNDGDITGGGVGSVPVVKQADIDTAQVPLRSDLDRQYSDWLRRQSFPTGDMAVIVASHETLVTAPTVGQQIIASDDGTFPATLMRSLTVMLVRNAMLQQAAITQLNTVLQQDKTYSTDSVVTDPQYPVQFQSLSSKPVSNGVILSLKATATIVPTISVQDVQNLIAGKSVEAARGLLKQKFSQIQQAEISTSPGIGSWTPYWVPSWTSRITVHVVPG